MEKPDLRSCGRATPIGLTFEQGNQVMQPPVAPTTQPPLETAGER
jgi:hypothetical protein